MRSKEEYLEWLEKNQQELTTSLHSKNRPVYHFAPPIGWLNDPNGLFEKDGVIHLYYQYSPDNIDGSRKIWGHATTTNFIEFTNHTPFLFADTCWDKDGVYSGSAVVEDDEIKFYYTGNVRHSDQEYDYINAGREQNTIMVTSKDGFITSNKQLLLSNNDYPKDMSNHVRDPKIIIIDNKKYMILGARTKASIGCAIIYEEVQTNKWEYLMCIESTKEFGYMWECPDIVAIEGKLFLITCPQGIAKEKHRYLNKHQNGYFPLSLNPSSKEYYLGDFELLDYGFDFYAPQTYKDHNNRIILIAWMAVPEAAYISKEESSSWNHMMTIPRELVNVNGKIRQIPVAQLKKLRKLKHTINITNDYTYINKTNCFEMMITLDSSKPFRITLRNNVFISYDKGLFTLDMSASNCGRKKRYCKVDNLSNIHIYSDVSSLEIFINNGQYVLSTRVFEPIISPIEISIVDGTALFEYYELSR